MIRSVLAAGLRSLLRNKLHATINTVGLAVGFAGAIFATLFLRDELTYDRWIPGSKDLYVVATTYAPHEGDAPLEYLGSYRDVPAWLKLDFPQIRSISRLREQDQLLVRHGDVRAMEDSAASVDDNFFSTLPFPAIAGALTTALNQPDGAVLTRAMARKYFGVDSAVGETFEMDGHLMRVTAVVEDLPANSSFKTTIFISSRAPFSSLSTWEHRGPDVERYWKCCGHTYVRLRAGTIGQVRQGMREFVERRMQKDILGPVEMRLIPMADAHLGAINNPASSQERARLWAAIYGVAGLGVLIVLGAALNFVNAMTAHASRRAVEVGIRKVSGAATWQLMIQFLAESLFYTCIAMSIAAGLCSVVSPEFQRLLGRSIPFEPWHDPMLAVGMVVAAVVTGILAGIYPAFVLSALRPAAVLKGGAFSAAGSSVVRRALVLLQFTILAVFAVMTAVVFRQTKFAMNESLRFDKDQMLLMHSGCTEALRTQIAAVPGVRLVACGTIDYWGYLSAVVDPEGKRLGGSAPTAFSAVDPRFFDVVGVKPIAGRFFSADHGEDLAAADGSTNPSVVINETAVRQLGFASASAAIGQEVSYRRRPVSRKAVDQMPLLPSRIVGVTPDLFLSVERPAPAVVYYSDLGMSLPQPGQLAFADLLMKLGGGDVASTLDSIDRLWSRLGNPGWPVRRSFLAQNIEASYDDLIREEHFIAVFAVITLFVAAIGIFGLSALTADRRTKEVGIRKVMGAGRIDLLRLLLWDFAQPVLWANILAWPLAFVIMQRWLEGFAYHIDMEPWMFLAPSCIAAAVAMLTVLGHSILIARAQPSAALRYQ